MRKVEQLDERAFKRVVIDIEVEAQIGDVPCRAFVYDLSCDGCSIEILDGKLRRDDHIVLNLPPATRVSGRLAWQIGLNGGVQFSERIGVEVVECLSLKVRQNIAAEEGLKDGFGRPLPRPRGGHKPPRWLE